MDKILLDINETTNSKTITYSILSEWQKRVDDYFNAYKRAKDFDLFLFNTLKRKGSITEREYLCLMTRFYHSPMDTSIQEIFDDVFKETES